MKNFVGVCVADSAEQVRIGQRPLQRVIAAAQRFRKRDEIGIHYLEPTWVVRSERCLTLNDMQGCLPLGTRFGEDQRSVLKIERQEADFTGDRSTGRLPAEAPRDHQVEYEKQFTF